jgi:3-methyladenine DNA glycosylase AlkC
MAEPFKNLFNVELIRTAAKHLARHDPQFDAKRFVKLAAQDLDALEMKARAMQVASALEATLPQEFERAASVLEAALAPPYETERSGELAGTRSVHEEGLAGWILWSAGEYVARRGLDEPKRALRTLHAFTQRFSAEFAIRPFLAKHPALGFKTLERWSADPNLHVRRLVSEGSRPRLPWGLQLKALIADPSPTLPLLRTLQDDSSDYVRRSVANHLNDIAKDHPEVVAEWIERHLPEASEERRALLRHASRTLVKKGHKRTLAAFGLGKAFAGAAALTITPSKARVGGEVTLALELRSSAKKPQALVIDYAVHHVKADGSTSPKVFKGWKLTLAPGEVRSLAKRHSLKPISTRRYYAGEHPVSVQANGVEIARAAFRLQLA